MVVRHSSSGVFDDLHPQHDVHLQHRGVHGRAWGATDEAKAAAHAGLMIATKPAFSALSSYVWGSLGDKVGFRITMLSSAAITAALTAALGAVDTFYLALVVRALSGFFDGVMTLSKSAMAKISDRTNSA